MLDESGTAQDIEEERQESFFTALFGELKDVLDRFAIANQGKDVQLNTMAKSICAFAGSALAKIYHVELHSQEAATRSWQDYGDVCLGQILLGMDAAIAALEEKCPARRHEQGGGGQP